MAHKKGQGSVRNGRDSVSKRLGVKRYGGELVSAGELGQHILRGRPWGRGCHAGRRGAPARVLRFLAAPRGRSDHQNEGEKPEVKKQEKGRINKGKSKTMVFSKH